MDQELKEIFEKQRQGQTISTLWKFILSSPRHQKAWEQNSTTKELDPKMWYQLLAKPRYKYLKKFEEENPKAEIQNTSWWQVLRTYPEAEQVYLLRCLRKSVPHFKGNIFPKIREAFLDPRDNIKREAIKILKQMEQDATPILPDLMLMLEEKETTLYLHINQLFLQLGGQAVSSLSKLFNHSEKRLREKAFYLISGMGDSAKESLQTHLNSLSESIERKYVICLLGDLGVKAILPELIQISQISDPEIQGRSTLALGNFKDPKIVPPLLKLIQEGSVDLREKALSSLYRAELKTPKVLNGITQALKDPSPQVQSLAAIILSSFCELETVPALSEALTSKNTLVQLKSAQALSKMEKEIPAVIDVLLQNLKSSEWNERYYSTLYLGDIGPKAFKAISSLEELLYDDVPIVVSAAQEALQKISEI